MSTSGDQMKRANEDSDREQMVLKVEALATLVAEFRLEELTPEARQLYEIILKDEELGSIFRDRLRDYLAYLVVSSTPPSESQLRKIRQKAMARLADRLLGLKGRLPG